MMNPLPLLVDLTLNESPSEKEGKSHRLPEASCTA